MSPRTNAADRAQVMHTRRGSGGGAINWPRVCVCACAGACCVCACVRT